MNGKRGKTIGGLKNNYPGEIASTCRQGRSHRSQERSGLIEIGNLGASRNLADRVRLVRTVDRGNGSLG